MLSYTARDRTSAATMPLEFVVHKMTQNSASVYGLTDRGVIAPGYQADFTVITDSRQLDNAQIAATIKRGTIVYYGI